MCLGLPMKILAIDDELARCERDGIQRTVALTLLDQKSVEVGDYVVVHLGFAIERIAQTDAKDAEETWTEWTQFRFQHQQE